MSISFMLDKSVYYSGHTINGYIMFDIDKRTVLQSLQVMLIGEERINIAKASKSRRRSSFKQPIETNQFLKKKILVSPAMYVATNRTNETVDILPGKYKIPFSIQIPDSMPSSVTYKRKATIEYTLIIRAKGDSGVISGLTNMLSYAPPVKYSFQNYESIAPERIMKYRQPRVVSDSTEYSFPDHSRKVFAKFSLSETVIQKGESLPLLVTVETDCLKDIVKITAKIEVLLVVNNSIEDQSIVNEVEEVIHAGDSKCLEQLLQLLVPKDTNCSVNSAMFSLKHVLTVTIHTKHLYGDLLLRLDDLIIIP